MIKKDIDMDLFMSLSISNPYLLIFLNMANNVWGKSILLLL